MITFKSVHKSHTSPFCYGRTRAILADNGIMEAGSLLAADVIVGETIRQLNRVKMFFPWKRYLLWTNEPRYSVGGIDYKARATWRRGGIRIMDVFTGDVFWNNLHFLGAYHYLDEVDLGLDLHALPTLPSYEDFRAKKRKVAAIYTRKAGGNRAASRG